MTRYITGWRKCFLYGRIALTVAGRYGCKPSLFGWSPVAYGRFLQRALRLLLVFRHHKAVRTNQGYKLDLYLPAYPSEAFFWALEGKLLRTPPRPVTVVYSMTKACPYRCSHCYQRKDENAELDESVLIATAKELQKMGVALFDIEGGEPFVRFPRLLKLMESLDERSELWVNTTGAGIKPGMLEQLKRTGLFGVMVSIHSPRAQKHDELTGVRGSWDVACETVKQSRVLGIAVAINSVLSEPELRADGLDQMMELAKRVDADFVQLIHPKPAGMWLGRDEGMQKEAGFIRSVENEAQKFNSRHRKEFPSLVAQVYEESSSVLGCTAGGVDRFYVNATGEIQPCEFLNVSFGNVREEPLDLVFSRMRDAFKEPACDWLCCTQGAAIHDLIQKSDLKRTPLPWAQTKGLVEKWNRGQATPLYKKLGIYR